MTNFRLHTPEELQMIAEKDFDKFYELAKEYYRIDRSFYVEIVRPILKKINGEKDNKSNDSNMRLPSLEELGSMGIDITESTEPAQIVKFVYCTKCGKENKLDSNFCFNCGNVLVGNKSNIQTFDSNKLSDNLHNETQVPIRENIVDNKKSSNWLTLGFFSAIVSIFFFPIPFGIFGAYCGYMATKYGKDGGGAFIIILSLICAAIGVIYGITSVTK